MDNYKYLLLSEEDIAEINNLFKDTFNIDPKSDFIRWKYFKNPYGNALLAGAFFNDKLVGSGAFIPEKMIVFGAEETIYKFTDLMTHPLHQRKGLSKNINKLLGEEIMKIKTSFSYTLCSKISTKSFVRNNWNFLDASINFFKPWLLLKIITIFRNNNFSTLKYFDSISDHLDDYKFLNNKNQISIKKTPDYLVWRTSNPNFKYRLICSYDDNNMVNGYLIFSTSKNNILNIIDIESNTNDNRIVNKLLSSVEYTAVNEKYKGVLVFTIKNTPFYKYIKSKNYIRNPFDFGPLKTIIELDVYLYNKSFNNISNLKLWDIKGLNYDDI
jgi:hypothetical protein